MYSSRKLPAEFDEADRASKRLVAEIVNGMTPEQSSKKISATENWYANNSRRGNLYLLREGTLAYRREGRLLFSFNEGDLVGVEHVFCPSDAELATEFAVVVDEFTAEGFFDAINGNQDRLKLWNEYLAQQFKLFSIMLASLVNEQEGFVPDLRFYSTGETIAEQGKVNDEIYTLVEGMAEVVVDGNKVADVLPDEVFGALGGLSGEARIASVVAAADCMVVVLQKSQFRHMLLTRPATVTKLIEDMARLLQQNCPREDLLQEMKG